MTRVLIVRGHLVTPWELRPWMELPERFEVRTLLTESNRYAPPAELTYEKVGSLRGLLPKGPVGELATRLVADRYRSADEAFAWADIVHAEELGFWFAADAARRRPGARFRLVQTVWETLPMLAAYRNRLARGFRDSVLAHTDLFLATTERAALALRLEGVEPERVRVSPPGIDTARFPVVPLPTSTEHLLVSPGRLVWEKGHQDVLRALALLHRGLVTGPAGDILRPHLAIVGVGPEEARLRAHADELGIGHAVTIAGVPYEEMPATFARASALVLMTQAAASAALHPFGIPHAFWEEQFGMVYAEAMATGLDIVTTTSGAVPEVLAGTAATLVAPGDWVGLARALANGPLSRPPGQRISYPIELVRRYSTSAAAQRLADAYDALSD
jgi:glycosyltransferase involved in cell wall biosynthesis